MRPEPRFGTVDQVEGPGRSDRGGVGLWLKDRCWAGVTERADGDRFCADIAGVVHTYLNERATMLLVEWLDARARIVAPAIKRVTRRSGRVARAVTADRGYGQAAVERDLHELGVRAVAIPRQATTSAARKNLEHSRSFHRLVKWRTGSEGRISYLKRGYGWDRTRLDTRQGAAIWCGHGVFAHNLVKIGALAS